MEKHLQNKRKTGHLILVVDDDACILGLFRNILELSGFSVVEANRAADALQHPSLPDVDLAIVDVDMPQMSGFDLCRSLKERFPGMPVLLMSGNDANGASERIRTVGADAFIAKPFTIGQFDRLLAALLPRVDPPS